VTGAEGIPAGSGATQRRPDPATCLYAARALRDFGDGFVAILIVVYLTELGLGPLQVGLIATAALLGSSLLTLGIGLLGRPGTQRMLLICAAALMTATGIAFAAANDFAWLLVIAFVGTVNPSAGNVGIFVPMEHALLANTAPRERRTRMFAVYGLRRDRRGIGSLAAGSPDFARDVRLVAHRRVESDVPALCRTGRRWRIHVPAGAARNRRPESRPRFPLGESKRVVMKLAGLFCIDSFA
jgi:hypothetical protein